MKRWFYFSLVLMKKQRNMVVSILYVITITTVLLLVLYSIPNINDTLLSSRLLQMMLWHYRYDIISHIITDTRSMVKNFNPMCGSPIDTTFHLRDSYRCQSRVWLCLDEVRRESNDNFIAGLLIRVDTPSYVYYTKYLHTRRFPNRLLLLCSYE